MWREDLRMAAGALRSHAFRSSLTVLGIFIGAFAIVLMTSLAQSGLATLERSFEEMGGVRIVMIAPKRPERVKNFADIYNRGFTEEDRDVLFERLPHLQHAAMYANAGRHDAANSKGLSMRTSVLAGDERTLSVFNLQLAKGRTLSADDSAEHSRVCVVAYEVAQSLFQGEAVGKWLTVEGLRCRVVGQLTDKEHPGMGFGFEWKNFVLVPLRTWTEVNANALSNSLFFLKTDSPANNELVKRIANAILIERHNGVDDFEFWDFAKMMEDFYAVFAIMQALVAVIAGISLLVGGIGVMNMMLVSVSERVREIGIRKALGARQGDIQRQFLLEASMLAGAGGVTGAGMGMLLALGANAVIGRFEPNWVSEISMAAVTGALVVSAGLGVGFGFFPALRAARLDPVEAIRS